MNKIKIVGLFIFLLSITLTFLSIYISDKTKLELTIIDTINKQKAFTQDISKNIFYIYKNKINDDKELVNSIKKFMLYRTKNEKKLNELSLAVIQNEKIVKLWNKFYLGVQNFRDLNKVTTMYSSIILEKIVNDIYKTNLMLIREFDKLINTNKLSCNNKISTIKNIQYTLFIALLLLLIYLFTQLKTIISFMQQFLHTSKKIITNSTIKGIEPINMPHTSNVTLEASNNFNFLVEKINTSIQNTTNSMQHSYESLEDVERNIEDMLDLLYSMNTAKEIDKDLTKKEDAIIQSLEELSSCSNNLKNLKIDLSNLISQQNLK